MAAQVIVTRPRVGLLGNPSDGFGGRVIAFTFEDFRCEVRFESADHVTFVRPDGSCGATPRWQDSIDHVDARGLDGGGDLMAAAVQAFDEVMEPGAWNDLPPARVSVTTDIPRQVGLSGSSAIVVGMLRGLMQWCRRVDIDDMTIARVAWRAETDILGIAAGPQDRVIQSHGGVLDMDFGVDPWRVHRIDPKTLPPMLLAWTSFPGQSSGEVHDDVRERFEAGDEEVVAAMSAFPEFARLGAECLASGDADGFRALVDKNFDQRASIWQLATEDLEMVEIGRALGAAVKFCGSGGAVVAVARDEDQLPGLERAYRDAGFATVRPTIESTPAREPAS